MASDNYKEPYIKARPGLQGLRDQVLKERGLVVFPKLTIPKASGDLVQAAKKGPIVAADAQPVTSIAVEIEAQFKQFSLLLPPGESTVSRCRPVDSWWHCYHCWIRYDRMLGPCKGSCAHCEHFNKYRIAGGWADFINSKLPAYTDRPIQWDWFLTITFANPTGKNAQVRGWDRMGWATAWKAWGAFQVYLQHHLNKYGADYDYTYFVVLELQKRGAPHFHALLHHPMLYRAVPWLRNETWKYLKDRNGLTKVSAFDPAMGAEFYASKYCTKDDNVEWDFKYEQDRYSFRKYEEIQSDKERLFSHNWEGDGLHGYPEGP